MMTSIVKDEHVLSSHRGHRVRFVSDGNVTDQPIVITGLPN